MDFCAVVLSALDALDFRFVALCGIDGLTLSRSDALTLRRSAGLRRWGFAARLQVASSRLQVWRKGRFVGLVCLR